MVVIPNGEFKMGSEDTIYEKPVHRVVIPNAFAIGRREVTFDEWDLCVAAGACKYRPDDRGWGRGNRPVIDVSWDDAHDFVSWMSQKTGKKYRLPSEAEWEYAARAGTESPFWWGRTLVKGSANCEDCGDAPLRKTTPAQSFRPNGFGLFDVAGNVAEWVEDCWNDNYRGAPADGTAWTTGQCQQRSLRGGSFASKVDFCALAGAFQVRPGRALLRQWISRRPGFVNPRGGEAQSRVPAPEFLHRTEPACTSPTPTLRG